MEWNELKRLVDGWHESAKQINGYRDTVESGDGVQLLLFVNRTRGGDMRLSVMSARDYISTVRPQDLFTGERDPNARDIPYSSITVSQPR